MKKFTLVVIVSALLILIAGLTANPYVLFVLNRAVIYLILCLGLNLLVGYAGQLAFAHAAMFGIGAYATGLLQLHLGWSYFPSAAMAILITTVVGSCLTFPALRLSGLYLALSTLAFALAVQWVLLNWTAVTFGAGGFRVRPFDLGIGLSSSHSVFVLSLVVAVVSLVLMDNLLRTKFGRRFVTIRENEVAAGSLGINVTSTKLLAFAVSAAYAGAAGALVTPLQGFVAPESFDLTQMILMQIMIVVGGLGSILGSVLGVVVVLTGVEFLREAKGYMEIFFGVILIAFVMLQPNGISAVAKRWKATRESFLPRLLKPAPAKE